ncbi:hypothetical protein ACVWW4_000166 [Bradyrhizobium sp. LB7.1]
MRSLFGIAVIGPGIHLRADGKQGRKSGRPQQFLPMIVDLVLKTRVACRICTGLPFQNDRPPIRHDKARPDQEHARLPKCDLAIVAPDQPCSLGDKASSPGRRIVHRFCDLRRDLARQVGADSCDQSGRNDRSGLNDKRRSWPHKAIGACRSAIDCCTDECKLSVLAVLSKCFRRMMARRLNELRSMRWQGPVAGRWCWQIPC